MIMTMNMRSFLFFSFFILFSVSNIWAIGEFEYFFLGQEPIIRIGLATNASSVSITTTDSSLVAISPDEPQMFLETNRVSVSARAYRPPEIEIYHFEIPNVESQTEAAELGKRSARNDGRKHFCFDSIQKQTTWRVVVPQNF